MSATDNERTGEDVPETVEEGGSLLVVDAKVTLPNKTVVVVPGLSAAETIATVRQILGEFQESAAVTAYDLQLVGTVGTDGATTEVEVACPELTDIASLVQDNTTTLLFNLIPAEYNLKKVQDQLKRTNEILQNPPSLKGAVSKKTDSAAVAEPKVDNTLPKADDLFKPIDFGAFYGEVLFRTGDVEAVSKNARMASNKPIAEAVKSVFASGWNPPPPQRKIRGDLLYIEVVTANEGTLYITATPSGFYVNKSNRAHFDATPATNHCFAHELLDTLLKASASLKAAWASAVTARVSTPSDESPMDVMAWLYSQGRGHQAADAGLAKPQWNAYNSDAYKNFTEGTEATSARTVDSAAQGYNLFRAQSELSSLHGVPELGAPREWNDEIQSIRALKANDVNERVMKAKLEYKVLSEFASACRATAIAITDGLIAPLSFGDPAASDIYVYNGIFFSKAEDSKDSFKICNGDEAYKKSTSRELQNQRLIRSLDIEGVGLILCATIDYKGQRIIGQSIIPGIFAQGENVARLMYGILEKEKVLTVKNSSLKIMQAVCEKLHIPTRTARLYPFGQPPAAAEAAATEGAAGTEGAAAVEGGMLDEPQGSAIKVDTEDNVSTSSSTPFVGPIEGKVLRGSDGRDYLLEMMRLTPRDANYVRGAKGTGKVATLEGTDADLAVAYVLRPELVNLFVQRRLNVERQKVMVEAAATQKELLAAATAKAVEAAAGKTEAEKEAAAAAEPTLDDETMARLTTEYTDKIRNITVESLNFSVNPNAFLDFEIDVDAAVVQKDEDTARELAVFLWETVLPAVTKQVRDGDIQVKDNATMVKLLHRNGVNMRYLGALATLAATEEADDEKLLGEGKQKVHAMPHFWREMVSVEVIARAVKYVLNGLFKQSEGVFAAPAQTIASLLNHLLSALVAPAAAPVVAAVESAASTAVAAGKNAKKANKKGKAEAAPAPVAKAAVVEDKLPIFTSPDATVSREASLKAIQDAIAARFCLALPLLPTAADASEETKTAEAAARAFLQSRLSALTVLRRVCQVCGVQIATRKYDFSAEVVFHAADVVSLVPVMKTCEPDVILPEFHEMLESAQAFQQEGNHAYAYEMAQQALNTITQITGPYHVHAAQAVDQVGNVLIAAGDYAAAEQYAQKSLAISLQLHGFDSQECILQHVKMGVLESELGHRAAAAKHFLSAKYILQVASGDRHSELSTVFARLASLYDEAGDFEAVWQCYVKAKFHTSDLMQICTLNIALASACSRNGHHIEALELQRQAYTMLKELVGEKEESQLSEIKATLEQYLRAVNEEKQASYDLVNERLEQMTAKMGQAKLQGKEGEQNKVVATAPLNDDELLKAFAEIDARNKKAAKNAAKKTSTNTKAKK